MALDELQDQKSFGAHWSRLGDVRWKKNTADLFRNNFPVNYRSSSKKHFKFPGNLKPILGNESVVPFAMAKTTFFQNAQNTGAVFPPTGGLCLDDIKSSETTLQESANKVDSLSSWGAKHWRWYTNYLRKIFPAYHGQSRSQSPSFNIQVRGQDISNSENLYIYKWFLEGVYLNKIYKNSSAQSMLCKEKKTYAPSR